MKEAARKTYCWNPQDYRQHACAQYEWAMELVEKLDLRGDESLLDIGCGEGTVTAAIAALLPRGRVVGIDSSREMIAFAKQLYGDHHHNMTFQVLNALDLRFENAFDVAFSNAAMHWIKNHRAVLCGVCLSLKEKGRILFQMGGKGNACEVLGVLEKVCQREAWRPFFEGFIMPYGFYGPDAYAQWLPEVGFETSRIALIPKKMKKDGKAALAGWIRTTWLPYTDRVPDHLKNAFIAEVVDTYVAAHPPDKNGIIGVDMMRLEVEARRS